ncbi:DNA topoisomerase IV subunit B [Rhodomicrobium vannielii ATCC 17100]|uniref:DNA topoisomerase IV subunit B n=1 Tax=Rhodomicrobium vannielii TaxID=1069 RepID=UPI00191881D0|nr:DNA topoisomerase IV subunit B [Rhodomicrobium vannielii]MBJ7533108.1 DNA topoisomerase IV subunit B [Rhodomicrobium vannielii ATCC 17100]
MTKHSAAVTRDLFGEGSEPEKPKAGGSAARGASPAESYTAADIEVLEGLEPVRRRPGMYIGGTDEKAMHHLFAEVIDNAMDEAVAGYASFIEVALDADGTLSVADNGRGIPIDPHPKYPGKSALEVIMTTLHSGGKFNSKVYSTSGGLHGVGISVVNALAEKLEVEVARNGKLYRQTFARGLPTSKLEDVGVVRNRRGTTVRFHPDPEIFKERATFRPVRIFKMARAKAYLFGGVEIRWTCAPELLKGDADVPEKAVFHFPGGLRDFLSSRIEKLTTVTKDVFSGRVQKEGGHGSVEWAIAWIADDDGFMQSYCNTVPTPEGGTHEAGLRAALTKSLRAYGELTNNKRAAQITADDVFVASGAMLSVFFREPEFQGQTKDRLSSAEAARIVENTVKDAFDHWLTASPQQANGLLEFVIERAEERLRKKREKETQRQKATRRLRLPGKLADCSKNAKDDTEIFIVEGDSAGGSAKQARDRATQAILPLRGKILNVASASRDKLAQNQLLSDLTLALGCGTGKHYVDTDLRYDRVIIMTDADVDGAHIASLLITFFYRQMPDLIRNGHLFLAVPPLYRLSQGGKTAYARDDAHLAELKRTVFNGRGKLEVSRFKGLGEMMPAQLKETTMDRKKRMMLRVEIAGRGGDLNGLDTKAEETAAAEVVEQLMGNKPEARFRFIQERAAFAEPEALDI